MKYLQSYEKYLNSKTPFDEISKEKFYELYNENCKFHNINDIQLFRGMRSSADYVYSYPKTKRHSIEDENIHVILMSELESWKDFPKYDQSIIGASIKKDYGVEGYGNVYEIIPFDNTKIGVCPQSTVWDSFGGYDDEDNIKLTNNFLTNFLGINRLYDFTWKELKRRIKNVKIDELYFEIHIIMFFQKNDG